jgi:hypothetical protein
MSNRPHRNHPIGGVPNHTGRTSFHRGAAATSEYNVVRPQHTVDYHDQRHRPAALLTAPTTREISRDLTQRATRTPAIGRSAVTFPGLDAPRCARSPYRVWQLFLNHARLVPHDPHKRIADQARFIRTAVRQPHLLRQASDLHNKAIRLALDPDQPVPQPHFRRT